MVMLQPKEKESCEIFTIFTPESALTTSIDLLLVVNSQLATSDHFHTAKSSAMIL